jgi:hypothetical protein
LLQNLSGEGDKKVAQDLLILSNPSGVLLVDDERLTGIIGVFLGQVFGRWLGCGFKELRGLGAAKDREYLGAPENEVAAGEFLADRQKAEGEKSGGGGGGHERIP